MVSEPLRPLLLPQNRKVRHLQGIYIRNLTLSWPDDHTIEDTASSPSRSRSSSLQVHEQTQRSNSSCISLIPRSRKYSTPWTDESPECRQRKLEELMVKNLTDTFVTLHCTSQIDPIYISEIVPNSINPTFRLFDLSIFGPTITRLDKVVVKVWIKRKNFELFIQREINLQLLNFIGHLENRKYPTNCILIQLVDGIYAMDLASEYQKPKSGVPLATSSYSALLRLSNLDQSIQDALATREELAAQINELLHDRNMEEVLQAQEQVIIANQYLNSEHKRLRLSTRRRRDLSASIEARKKWINAGRELQAKVAEDIEHAQNKLLRCQKLLTNVVGELYGQRRRICEELQIIFPIDPVIHKPLLFTICGLQLPNSFFDESDEETISAALGYVAQIVDLLQYYFSIPLPYRISSFGSKAIIEDSISILQDKQHKFPLYMKGTARFRFEYGVFLLNKNIEWLAKSRGLKILDIRQTLPNLKYFLYICSAGTSELPARKAGGIKGLLFGKNTGSKSRYETWNQSEA